VARDALDGVDDVGDVGVLRLAQRGRDADDDGVAAGEDGLVGRGRQQAAAHDVLQDGRVDVADVGLAAVHLPDPVLRHVEAMDGVAGEGELGGERKPHISEADDGDLRLPRSDPFEQGALVVHDRVCSFVAISPRQARRGRWVGCGKGWDGAA